MSAGVLHTSHIDDFLEEGVVTATERGRAYVHVPEKGECEECSAKIFCSSNSAKANERTVLAKDPFGVQPGDTVRIAIRGGAVVTAGVFMYGVPLMLLLGGIFGGMELFKATAQPELYSFLASIAVLAVYYGVLFVTGRTNPHLQVLPEITKVHLEAN